MTKKQPDVPATITDEQWRVIQWRARKANPQLADTFSDAATARREQSSANYRNRKWN